MTRHFAKLQWSDWARKLPVEITLALAIGVVLALLGPYDTYRFPLLPRVGFWLGLSAAWFVLAGIAEVMGDALLPARIASAWRLAIVYAAAALPMGALVWGASNELTHGREPVVPFDIYWQTLLIGASASLIVKTLLPRLGVHSPPGVTVPAQLSVTPAEPSSAVAISLSRLEQRLPRHLRSAVLALSSEDHYVRIHTAQGSHMILMRLSDAIDELDGLPGERVHRSWWVAASAPSEYRARGRSAVLLLPEGLEVPISAPYLKIAETMADRDTISRQPGTPDPL